MPNSHPGNAENRETNRSKFAWLVLDEVRSHHYDTGDRASKPDDPGWHACSCGWEGYWCDWQPHLADRVSAVARSQMARDIETAAKEANQRARRASHWLAGMRAAAQVALGRERL